MVVVGKPINKLHDPPKEIKYTRVMDQCPHPLMRLVVVEAHSDRHHGESNLVATRVARNYLSDMNIMS